MIIKSLKIFLILTILFSKSLYATSGSDELVNLDILPDRKLYQAGDSYRLLFSLKIKKGYHIQGSDIDDPYTVATKLTLLIDEGVTVGKIKYPEAVFKQTGFSEKPSLLIEGDSYIATTIAIDPAINEGMKKISAKLIVQGCSDYICLAPAAIEKEFYINVVKSLPDENKELLNEEIYKANSNLFSDLIAKDEKVEDLLIENYFTEYGVFAYFIILLAGLALNLTPCVYPLIPITFSYFRLKAESGKRQLIILSLIYVLGISIAYSALGLFAALSGDIFGSLLQQKSILILLSIFLVLMALSMFDLYKIRMPSFLTDIAGKNRKGYFGTFLMGATVGIIAAPCIGPITFALIGYVSSTKDILQGVLLFLSLSIGLGSPYIVLAFLAGKLKDLPTPGAWMLWINRLFGFLILGFVIFLLRPLIGEYLYLYLTVTILIVAGFYLLLAFKSKAQPGWFLPVRIMAFLVSIISAAYLFISSYAVYEDKIQFIDGSDVKLTEIIDSGAPFVLYFSAKWCIPCRELDQITFRDPELIDFSRSILGSNSILMLKVDLTFPDDERTAIKEKFKVRGVPTILFFTGKDPDMGKVDELTVLGYIPPDQFKGRLARFTEFIKRAQ